MILRARAVARECVCQGEEPLGSQPEPGPTAPLLALEDAARHQLAGDG